MLLLGGGRHGLPDCLLVSFMDHANVDAIVMGRIDVAFIVATQRCTINQRCCFKTCGKFLFYTRNDFEADVFIPQGNTC